MIPIDKVENIVSRFNELESILAKPDLKKDEFVSNSKEYSNLNEIISYAKNYLKVLEDLKSTKNILEDKSVDKEFYEMAEKELKDLKQHEEECVKRLKVFLLPKDEADEKNAIIEIRAGTGGMEAALFAADLFNMYQKVAVLNGWKVEIISYAKNYLKVLEDLKSTKNILEDKSTDKEFYEMAEKELKDLKQQEEECVKRLKVFLLPKDEADEKNAIIEIRAGTGGMEAALFAADLFNMYQKVAVLNGWKVEIINLSNSEGGGYKEIIASIVGRNVFSKLKFESGVHRVQRVPDTETQGRIHTSAATVAVLPEAEEVDVKINDADLRIDVFRSSGPGGQSVNTTDSAVRVTHIPSGIVVSQQDEKSQHKNKAKALKILRSKLYDLQRSQQESERAKARKSQIGTGDRSERIRTYNFPQGRVTDHRINMTLYKLTDFLAGDAFKELSDAIQIQFQEEQLENLKI